MADPKQIILATAPDGAEVAFVELGRDGEKGTAMLDQLDLNMLIDLGLSLSWNRLETGYVTTSAKSAPGRSVLVARVLLDAGEGQAVVYLDGDPTNLRRENLQIIPGWGLRRDREFLTPLEKRKLGRRIVFVQANREGIRQ